MAKPGPKNDLGTLIWRAGKKFMAGKNLQSKKYRTNTWPNIFG